MKQAIIIRKDLKLPKGKMAAQAAHAAVEAVLRSDKKNVIAWREVGAKKIAVYAADQKQLFQLEQDAKQSGIITAIITDAGKTTVPAGTVTCCGLGPDKEEVIDKIIKELQLV